MTYLEERLRPIKWETFRDRPGLNVRYVYDIIIVQSTGQWFTQVDGSPNAEIYFLIPYHTTTSNLVHMVIVATDFSKYAHADAVHDGSLERVIYHGKACYREHKFTFTERNKMRGYITKSFRRGCEQLTLASDRVTT